MPPSSLILPDSYGESQPSKLKNFAIYYGWPSCTNSSTLKWNLESVAGFYAQFDYVVFGGDVPGGSIGLASEAHGDHAKTKEIIHRMMMVNPHGKVYGYITIGCGPFGQGSMFTLDQLSRQIDSWSSMGAKGIFVDEAGFDYWLPGEKTEMRMRQVAVARYCHQKGMSVTFNAWNPNDLVDLLSHSQDTAIPWNQSDAILYESYIFSSAEEDPNSSHAAESFRDYRIHLEALQKAKTAFGIDLWGCQTTSQAACTFDPRKWDFMVAAATADGVDAVSWTTSQYSASGPDNAVLPYRPIPDWVEKLTRVVEVKVGFERSGTVMARTDAGDVLTLEFGSKTMSILAG
ncbi:hypothetical protein HDU67_001450 [Dinochytrium kinnereticum]|nr:hypothetical protein HDU67_001450 [Dinochytrium kinnereticum]